MLQLLFGVALVLSLVYKGSAFKAPETAAAGHGKKWKLEGVACALSPSI